MALADQQGQFGRLTTHDALRRRKSDGYSNWNWNSEESGGRCGDTGTPVTPPPHAEFDRTAGQQFGENQYPGSKGSRSLIRDRSTRMIDWRHAIECVMRSSRVRVARWMLVRTPRSAGKFES